MQRFCFLLLLVPIAAHAVAESPKERAGLELFEKKIRPALIEHCYECHAADSSDLGGKLLLDSRSGLLAGGETGPAIVAGKPRQSLLMRAIEYRDLEMPPNQKLPDSVIADFRRWIALGAPDPRDDPLAVKSTDGDNRRIDLWSLRPRTIVAPPAVDDTAWPRSDADRFILARLCREGLRPNQDAEPTVLLRRIYFDLIGLPPGPDQVAAFLADPSPAHFEQIVDRLLASAQFGQRWGRHWLDVARYAESAGSSRDVLMLYAWRYRDYVIDAMNADMPYDRFISEQIAGDLLPAATADDKSRQMVATGLLAIGSKSLNGGNLTYDVIDDQIDVVSKAVLGLTVACARCHDHKFDPIPTADYYSLAGIFLSTDTRYGGGTKRPNNVKEKLELYLTLEQELDSEIAVAHEKAKWEVERLNKHITATRELIKSLESKLPPPYRNQPNKTIDESLDDDVAKSIHLYQLARRGLQQHAKELKQAEQRLGADPQYAVGVQEAKKISDANILMRGEKDQPGDSAKRGFLSAIGDLCESNAIDSTESGRLQLAAWLVHRDNPLTARVAVNRIWQHLMGSGLVETVDNFGMSGLPPSHPELLDHLACRFVHTHHWSTKGMIRELVLSRSYRLSSEIDESCYTVDPDNRLRWRMPRRRLEAEPLRDAMLAVSGLLDVNRLEGSLVMQIGEGEVGRNINTAVLEKPFNHRSVYLPIIRGIIPEQLNLFDFPEPSNVQGLRDSNITPTQSLFLMNSEFAIRIAGHFADQLLADQSLQSDLDRIQEARLRCFATESTPQQIARDADFLDRMLKRAKPLDAERRRLAWTAYCQTLVASAKFRFID